LLFTNEKKETISGNHQETNSAEINAFSQKVLFSKNL